MDVTEYRLDLYEKRADAVDARMARIEDKLEAMQVTLAGIQGTLGGLATKEAVAGLATKDAMRNWGLTLLATMIGTSIAPTLSLVAVMVSVGGLFTSSSANQLAAFQAGLSTIQAVVAAHDARPAPAGGQPDKPAATPPPR
jgi:hypothetical protein